MANMNELRDWYHRLEWEVLERKELGNSGSLRQVTEVFNRIRSTFDFLLANINFKNLSPVVASKVFAQLQSFKSLYSQVSTFTDVSMRTVMESKVRDFEYTLSEEFGKYFSYFQLQSALGGIKKTSDDSSLDIEKLKTEIEEQVMQKLSNVQQTQPLVSSLLENKERIENALSTVNSWLEANNTFVESVIAQNANDAARKAIEHKTFYIRYVKNPLVTTWRDVPLLGDLLVIICKFICKVFPFLRNLSYQPSWHGTFLWLVGSIFFGTIVLALIGYFIYLDQNVSLGNAVLRISAILVPSYFTVLFAQQYLNHRKLYEAYMFRNIALQTMLGLRTQFEKGSAENKTILEKSLNVLFSEPSVSGDLKFDKTLAKEVLEIVRKNLPS